MRWYWWILVVILGLNVFAIAMLGFMMAGDWVAQRRMKKCESRPPDDDSPEDQTD